jgi:hypothetical protein
MLRSASLLALTLGLLASPASAQSPARALGSPTGAVASDALEIAAAQRAEAELEASLRSRALTGPIALTVMGAVALLGGLALAVSFTQVDLGGPLGAYSAASNETFAVAGAAFALLGLTLLIAGATSWGIADARRREATARFEARR